MSHFFDDIPPYGRLIILPKRRPDFQVMEWIEYDNEILRNPIGRAWKGKNTLIEVPGAVYELFPLKRDNDVFSDGQSSPSLPPLAGQEALSSLVLH